MFLLLTQLLSQLSHHRALNRMSGYPRKRMKSLNCSLPVPLVARR